MHVSTGSPRPPPEWRESGRALPKLILTAVLLTLGLVILATAVTVYAVFTDSDSVTPNDFTSDTLDPPTSLSATGGASADLTWTATVDTYASGHRVLRGTASGGPYSQIAEVTPRTTTTYTDSPADGTYYYVMRSFFQSWESVNGNEASATVGACTAGDTGFLSATAEAADTGGDDDGFESNPTGAFADAGGIASNINGPGDRHRFYNYGFTISGACTISGIEVRLDWWMDALNGTNSMDVELSWDGGTTWTAAKTDTLETTTEHTATLGSSTDTWGRMWSVAETSDANFRVRLTSQGSNARDFFLDWVPVKIYYAPPAVTILDAWTTGTTHAVSAGTNRLLLVGVYGEDSGVIASINTVTWGGQTLTEIGEATVGTGYSNLVWMGYLNDAGIAAASGNTIVATWSGTTPNESVLYSAVTLEDVDQTTPIGDSDTGTNTAASTVQIASTLNVSAGDMATYVTVSGEQGRTHTADTGYTEGTEEDSGGVGQVASNATKTITSAGTEQPAATWSGGANVRLGIVGAVIKLAP